MGPPAGGNEFGGSGLTSQELAFVGGSGGKRSNYPQTLQMLCLPCFKSLNSFSQLQRLNTCKKKVPAGPHELLFGRLMGINSFILAQRLEKMINEQ